MKIYFSELFLDSYIEDRGHLIKKLDEAVDEILKLNRQLNG